MAAIDSYLAEIKTAVYGEDVRNSIYNSLSAMNDEVSSVMTTAKNTINNYVNNIEIYSYVDELPEVGNEQKIYLVQDDISYTYEWSNEYVATTSDVYTLLPQYLYLDGQENNEECPEYLSGDNWFPFETNDITHDFGVIVHISDYTANNATVANPEYALLVVSIKCSDKQKMSTTSKIFTTLRSVMRAQRYVSPTNNVDNLVGVVDFRLIKEYDDSKLYLDWSNCGIAMSWLRDLQVNTDIVSTYNTTIRYAHVDILEYIYDSTVGAWKYNDTHSATDLYIDTLINNATLTTLANTSGTGLVSGLVLEDTNKSSNGWLIGVLRSATPQDSIYAMRKNVSGGPGSLHLTLKSPYVYVSVYKRNNDAYRTSYELTDFNCPSILTSASVPSLAQPLQVLHDLTYSGQMYVWNNQLQHYIAMKSEDTFIVDCDYNDSSGSYEYHLNKTFAEIDAYFRPGGTTNWKAEVKGCFTHPGPGRYGNLINWYYSSGFYYFKYEGTTATSTTETYRVFKLDSNDTLTEVND